MIKLLRIQKFKMNAKKIFLKILNFVKIWQMKLVMKNMRWQGLLVIFSSKQLKIASA